MQKLQVEKEKMPESFLFAGILKKQFQVFRVRIVIYFGNFEL